MSERPSLQHMCPMKGEWPSCLYFPHNQPWCHHEPSLNRPLSKNISLSPSPSLLIFHLSLLHSPGCLPPVRILLVKPHFFFLLFIRFFPFMPPLQLSLSLSLSFSDPCAFCPWLSRSNWISTREAHCQKYQDVLIKTDFVLKAGLFKTVRGTKGKKARRKNVVRLKNRYKSEKEVAKRHGERTRRKKGRS